MMKLYMVKRSLLDKMWGDDWKKFAGVKSICSIYDGIQEKNYYLWEAEFGQFIEWREYEQLEWQTIDDYEMHKKTKLL